MITPLGINPGEIPGYRTGFYPSPDFFYYHNYHHQALSIKEYQNDHYISLTY